MLNTKFEAYKVKRELKKIGKLYEFKRYEKNDFNEPEDEGIVAGSIQGIYHDYLAAKGGISERGKEATNSFAKKSGMILCLYDDVISSGIKRGDTITINDKIHKVVGIVNIQEWSIVADISLEVEDTDG